MSTTDTALDSAEIALDDMPDFAAESAAHDEPVLICAYDGCTNPIVKPARGRTPKFCDEHKPSRASTTAKSRGRAWSGAEEVEKQLNLYVYAIAGGMQFTVLANDGRAISKTGPALVHEVVELARTDKKLRDVLVKITAPGKYAPVGIAALALVVSVAANHIPLIAMAVPFIPGAVNVSDTPQTPASDESTAGGVNV
jgi:hypothetical protein